MRTIIRNNYDPHIGDYHERIIQDEVREKTWLFDCDGVYLDITAGRGDTKVVNELGDSEVFATSQKLVTDELGKKQDTLTAGENITIEGNVISAGGGAYTAGYGLTLTGTEFAANTSVLATKTDLAGKQDTLTTAQLAAVNSGIDSTKVAQIATNATDIDGIESKIPAQATSSNQLADKDFVNSSVATNTANFVGTFNTIEELEAVQNPTNNDYGFVIGTDSASNTVYNRYKFNGTAWVFEYALNNSSFTAEQWAAIQSGITSGLVTKLNGIAAGAEVNVQSNWNESDTSSDAYIQNKPTIPTVNDATLTITQNGTSAGTFTANASTDATIALTDTTYSAFTGATASTAGASGLVPAPAAGDESKVLKGDGTWAVPDAGIKTLTTADYNWPEAGTKTAWSADLADPGVYKVDESIASFSIRGKKDGGNVQNVAGGSIIVSGGTGVYRGLIVHDANQPRLAVNGSFYDVLGTNSLRNNLTTLFSGLPLDAYQGKVLNDKIEGRLKTNAGAPTTSTAGTIGQLLEDTTNGNLYICTNSASPYDWKQIDKDEILTSAGAPTTSTAGTLGQLLTDTTNAKLYQLTAIDTTDPQNPSYTWTEVGGSSVNIVQTTGTSTTDVMSQNAVTSMVYAEPSDMSASGVKLGASDSVVGPHSAAIARSSCRASNSAAIGYAAYCGYNNSVALGAYAQASASGQVQIGSTDTSYGYANSNYRLLSGVYDGQSAHDAATVAQGNTLSTTAPTTTTEGVLGQLYTDTTNMHTYQCTAIDTTDPQNPVYTWTQRW